MHVCLLSKDVRGGGGEDCIHCTTMYGLVHCTIVYKKLCKNLGEECRGFMAKSCSFKKRLFTVLGQARY